MGVQYSGGNIIDVSLNVGATPMASLMLGVAIQAAAAGWTVTTLGAYSRIYGNTNASNGQTTTIGGRVYTYKDVLAAADDILIGASALETLTNFKAAINGEPGEGTIYGAGTTPSTTVVAAGACIGYQNGGTSFTGGANLIIYTRGGAVNLSDSSSFNLLTLSLDSVLYKLVSQQTPAYQRATVYIGAAPDAPDVWLNMLVTNRDESRSTATFNNWASLTMGQTYQFIGHRYGFHLHINGSYNQRGQALYVQVPYIEGSLGPFSVSNVSVGGGGEVTLTVVEDIAAAGWQNGDTVTARYFDNANGTGVDGNWPITISGNSITLVGSSASGTFTTGLGLIANQTPPRVQQMEAVWTNCMDEISDSWPVASTMYFGGNIGGSSQGGFHGINDGTPYGNDSDFCGTFPVAAMRNATDGVVRWNWLSGDNGQLEPSICYLALYGANVGTSSALDRIGARGGQVYNAFLVQNNASAGGVTATMDGHNFRGVYNNDTYAQLMLAVT